MLRDHRIWETQPYRSACLAWGCAASENPSARRLAADVASNCCCGMRRFYVMSPKHCHAFVGYLEEEAVKTCAPYAQRRSHPDCSSCLGDCLSIMTH